MCFTMPHTAAHSSVKMGQKTMTNKVAEFFKLSNKKLCTEPLIATNRSELPTNGSNFHPTNQVHRFCQLMGQNFSVNPQLDLWQRINDRRLRY